VPDFRSDYCAAIAARNLPFSAMEKTHDSTRQVSSPPIIGWLLLIGGGACLLICGARSKND
jgi:hypothetical protein